MSRDDRITLADKRDAHHFIVGAPVRLAMNARGQLVPARWHHRLRARLARALWWRHPPSTVTEIDAQAGTVTVVAMSWSWRRWKWVRA